MKKIYNLLIIIFLAQISFGQSITIEPNPTDGVMLNMKNKPPEVIPPQQGSNYAALMPMVTSLPSSPQAGMVVFYVDKLQYYNGTIWVELDKALPPNTFVLSKNITNIAGYSLIGFTNLLINLYSTGSYAWFSQLNAANAPSGREGHIAVWTGDKMLIWGGNNLSSGTYLGDGKMYNLNTETWTSMSNSNAPTARGYHATSIWTGTKVIVWGGITNGGLINDGAIYDPNLDSWSTINSVNVPSARRRFTSVWTGDKMIVWGGEDFNYNAINDGKIYNPSSNTWSSMNSGNSPSAREWHSAVWTGSNMIVWGGGPTNLSTTLNTGGIYNPTTDSWVAMSAAPGGLYGHTAVWTGSKMIVFGGGQAPNYSNACYIYDPSSNSWTTASSINKPSARGFHTAIWTGSKMIVFGGYGNASTALNNGGIYDPATDTWANDPITLSGYINLNTTNFSYSRHTAVLAGEDMLIFGLSPGHLMKKDFQAPTSKPMYLFQKN